MCMLHADKPLLASAKLTGSRCCMLLLLVALPCRPWLLCNHLEGGQQLQLHQSPKDCQHISRSTWHRRSMRAQKMRVCCMQPVFNEQRQSCLVGLVGARCLQQVQVHDLYQRYRLGILWLACCSRWSSVQRSKHGLLHIILLLKCCLHDQASVSVRNQDLLKR